MQKLLLHILAFLSLPLFLFAQNDKVQVKVFEFEEGLSHRIVSKILQSEDGYIWISTINGLNRFDGYEFTKYNDEQGLRPVPFSTISDMHLANSNHLWLAGPDHLAFLDMHSLQCKTIKIKQGPSVARESIIPYNLFVDAQDVLWASAFDEKSAKSRLLRVDPGKMEVEEILELEGNYPQRPILQLENHLYLGAHDNELWKLDLQGQLQEKIQLPLPSESRITALAKRDKQLYALSLDGALYVSATNGQSFQRHPASHKAEAASALMVEANGDVWIGGRGSLMYFSNKRGTLVNYAPLIQDIVKNTCTYNQILRGESGVIWAASDFGAVKLVQGEQLFTNYLRGGNEHCSNVFCSTRGITEDEVGNIYFSYYSSIHVLDPDTDALRPLFPSKNFFNAPFGLTYFDGALWTGNGKRIDLRTKQIDNILDHPEKDLGHVIVGPDSTLWMGYLHWLYQYDPEEKILTEFQDNNGKWDSLDNNISYLHKGRTRNGLWVATLGNGVFWIDNYTKRKDHYHTGSGLLPKLRHNQVNSLYEDAQGRLWIGSAAGLHCLYPEQDSIEVYTTLDGLPNNFINGILPEGDSCLWISTDNGLCRLSLQTKTCTNFSVKDGISANEFNRISFYRASTGRMYFGGLNGINAFYPGAQFTEQKQEERETPLLLTRFSKFDGLEDSLIAQSHGLMTADEIILSPWDRIFSFEFALADYRDSRNNLFSYQLEGYDKGWSAPSKNHEVRYNNIPAGNYTFRVRAKANENSPRWNSQELAIPIVVQEAFYKTWWFWLLAALIIISTIAGFMRYRFYLARKRQRELEELIKARTRELEAEKQKSEELLLNILPAETAEELKANGTAKAKRHELVTVMFSDFKGFSKISEHMDPEDLVAEIDYCFRAFDEIMDKYQLEKIKTVGDAYLSVGGMHEDDDGDEAVRVTMAAMEIQSFMNGLSIQRKLEKKPFFEARIGIHTGPVVAGIVGIKKFAYDIWGDTVNLAARMETSGAAGKVNVSGRTFQLIREQFHCEYHGSYTETDGEDIPMYFVGEKLVAD